MSENTSSAADKQDSSSDEDQYNWDSDPGDLSFVHDTSSSGQTQSNLELVNSGQPRRTDSTADWPARPTSEEFQHYLENKSLPRTPINLPESGKSSTDLNFLDLASPSQSRAPDLWNILESNEDSVFGSDSEEVNDLIMPPQVQKLIEESLSKFKRARRNWNQNYDRLKDETTILSGDLEDMKIKRNLLEEIADDIFDNVEEESDIYTDMLEQIDKVRTQMSNLYKKQSQSSSPPGEPVSGIAASPAALSAPPVAANPDLIIDKEIMKLQSVLEFHSGEVLKLEKKLNDVTLATPDPTNETVKCVKEALIKSKSIEKAAEEIYLKSIAESSVYADKEKQASQRSLVDTKWKTISEKIEAFQVNGSVYVSKLSTIEVSNTMNTTPLERLPLPKFSGKSVDYIRFKLEFNKHVTYKTEAERVLAMKEKCLPKKDKDRVANKQSIEGIFDVLDDHYGGTNTTVCDVFKGWRALKMPETDQQIVDFVEVIENGVACLEALDAKNELSTSAVMDIEEKLNKRMRMDVSKLITNKDESTKIQDIIIKFLNEEKKSAQHRISNTKTKEKDHNKNDTSSNFTGARGRGRKRGQRGGRGRGQNDRNSSTGNKPGYSNTNSNTRGGRGRGRGKRSSLQVNCLLCDEQHSLSKCDRWLDQTTDKRFLLGFCQTNSICTYCLTPGHYWTDCWSQEELGCPCGSTFNQYICVKTDDCKLRKNWTNVTTNNTTNVVCNSSKSNESSVIVNGIQLGQAILPVQSVQVDGSSLSINMMSDNCSQNTFILDSTAKKLKCTGTRISYTLVCTDGSRSNKVGWLYEVALLDNEGNIHQVQAIGIDSLSSKFPGFKIKNIKKKIIQEFKGCSDLSEAKLSRSSLAVDMILGTDLASLMPVQCARIKDLVILKSKFGNGYTCMGHNKFHVVFTDKQSGVRANVCAAESITILPETTCNHVGTKDVQFLECINTESVGVTQKPKCRSCKVMTESCKECKMISQNTTYLEYLQDIQIEESIEKIPDAPGYVVSFPYNKEIDELLPNLEVSLKRAENIENTLKKKTEDMHKLNEVLKEGFRNGTFRWLRQEEIDSWSGLYHYVPMNVVYKESESTPIRCIFDCGQPDSNGRSLNSCMGKGSNPLNNFNVVILNFRGAEKVACGDIKKMFNQIAVRKEDMHLRRFLWRPDGFGGNKPWQVAVPTCVNFGETAAPSIATKVKNRAAHDYKHISKPVSDMIIHNCVMDDINITCKYNEEIEENIAKAEQILANGKFKFKQWIKSGDSKEKSLDTDVTKSLGLYWKTEQDLLVYRIKLNFSKKKRNRYVLPDTRPETLLEDFPSHMTKRLALKLNHSVFDPANLLQVWSLKLRLAFREILFYEKEQGYSDWDRPLPEKFRNQWIQLTKEMFQLESLEFPRSIIPRMYNSKTLPDLVVFSDGANNGQCAIAYLVWSMCDGSRHVSLVTGRTKIASMTKISTPRSEMVAAQLNQRLSNWLVENLREIEIGSVYHIVDASIILGMIKNVSLKFDSFTAPRITEIQTSTNIDDWYWIDTAFNPSDLGTRGKCSVTDIGPGTLYREGPSWLKEVPENWPLRSDFKKHQVPGLKKEFEILPSISNLSQLIALNHEVCKDLELLPKVISSSTAVNDVPNLICEDIAQIVDHHRYRTWDKLIQVTAQVLKVLYLWRLKVKPPDQVELMKLARKLWLKSMMESTIKMLEKKTLSGFIVFERDGIYYATTRNKQVNLNQEELVILSPSHPVTKKILLTLHNINHRGVQYTVARSRLHYWIPQAAKLVKSIRSNCFECRKLNADAMQQLMAPMPQYRLKPAPVWQYSMIDLFGPIEISNFVRPRTSRKTWAVIITCLNTRACWVYLSESYSTDHLLSVLRKHEARNGSPSQYAADMGRQIVGADRVISEAVADLDQNRLVQFAASRNTKFVFGTPYFPEGQGACERLIKEVKANLRVISKHKRLSFAEMDCLLSEASYLTNTRPLQLNPTLGEDGYICPNDILFGRSDMCPPMVNLEETSLTRKAAYKQKVIDEFWNKWKNSYYQSLVKYQKWTLRTRNSAVGDIVLVLDREVTKGKFCLGMVDTVKVDNDGVVRKVTIKYKNPINQNRTQSAFKYIERNVRKLALLVKVEERKEFEYIDFDVRRFGQEDEEDITSTGEDHEEDVTSTGEDNGEKDGIVNGEDQSVQHVVAEDDINENVLPSTSSGRKRRAPKKLDL